MTTTHERTGRAVSLRPADLQMRFRDLVSRLADEPQPTDDNVATLGPFVTLSRQVDSGGAEVAHQVGLRLGWAVFDRELVDGLARQLKLSPSLLELMDETRTNWFKDTLLNLLNSRLVLQDSYVSMLGRIMLLAAYDGRVVIVGRGGHLLLPRESGLRVRVIGPLEQRLARLCAREGIDPDTAADRLDQRDTDRADFIRRHFHCDPNDPSLYDLVIDTGNLGVDGAADLVLRALEIRGYA